ncbi:hypothetical protein [Candidatus Amarobacter glycogenicus]|uniref:hypothetical protein n=1 Tax=Candidatus Amarobacter glycogenicus TaxID=3140699 RepID=UPI0031CC84D6
MPFAALREVDRRTAERDGEDRVGEHHHADVDGEERPVLERRDERRDLRREHGGDAEHRGDDREAEEAKATVADVRLEGQVGKGYAEREGRRELVQV